MQARESEVLAHLILGKPLLSNIQRHKRSRQLLKSRWRFTESRQTRAAPVNVTARYSQWIYARKQLQGLDRLTSVQISD